MELGNAFVTFVEIAIVLAIGGAVFVWRQTANDVKLYIASKIGEGNTKLLTDMAAIVVRSLEQSGILLGFTGEQKKAKAVIFLTQLAAEQGIVVKTDVIDHLIEYAVQVMNEKLHEKGS